MASTRYTRSTDGSDADSGATWALAKATIAGVTAIDTTGDTLWVSQAHAESTAGAVTFAGAGTPSGSAFTKLYCGNDGAEPPTALATTATVTSSTSTIAINGSVYCHGIQWISATGINLNTGAGNVQEYKSSAFRTTSSGAITCGGASVSNTGSRVLFDACTFKFGSTGGGVLVSDRVVIYGGSLESGGSNPVSFFNAGNDRTHYDLVCTGFDFSNAAAGMHLFAVDSGATSTGARRGVVRDCKLPSGWSGNLINSTSSFPGQRWEMHNCSAGNTNYTCWIEDYVGSIKTDTTVTRTGGASDGTTAWSYKMSTNATIAGYPLIYLESPEIHIWNDTTGSAKTLTLEFIHDTNVAAGQGAGTAFAFQDNQVALRVQYLNDASFPLAAQIMDAPTNVLTAATDQSSSSVTWSVSSGSPETWQKQSLSVTLTPQQKGTFIVTVLMYTPSKTIYIDPKVTVS